MKVLVVDDAKLLRDRVVELVCEVPGVRLVAAAEDGQSALASALRMRPDVAILALDFTDTLDLLRQLSAAPRRSLVIVLGQASRRVRDRCLAAGAQHVFDKTAELGKLCAVLRAAIGTAGDASPPTLWPPNEVQRLRALHDYDILDTPPEPVFDQLARLAALMCGAPIGLITLIDAERQWCKARVGLAAAPDERNVSFCQHTVMRDAPLLVPDASADRRFADNPLVRDPSRVRFYAGVPLRTPDGHAIGALCVMDTVPRALSRVQEQAIEILAEHAVTRLELRRRLLRLQQELVEHTHAAGNAAETYRSASNDVARRHIDGAGLELDIRRALERDEFVLHYQPRFAVRDGGLSGLQGLVRWHHPQMGLLTPQRFLPLVEERGLLARLGQRVFELACEQASLWAASGWTPPPISVNVFGAELRHGLLSAVASALERNGLPSSALELDIDEALLLRELPALRRVLEQLGGMGVRVAIEAFGTGRTPLRVLQELPIRRLKIDARLIAALPSEARSQAIVRTVVAIARGLELEVCAQGVERAEQLGALAGLECDTYQGRYGCGPMPAEALTARLVGAPARDART